MSETKTSYKGMGCEIIDTRNCATCWIRAHCTLLVKLQAKLDALLPVLVQMKGYAEYELGEKPDAIFSQRNPHALKSGAERGLAILEGKE